MFASISSVTFHIKFNHTTLLLIDNFDLVLSFNNTAFLSVGY